MKTKCCLNCANRILIHEDKFWYCQKGKGWSISSVEASYCDDFDPKDSEQLNLFAETNK